MRLYGRMLAPGPDIGAVCTVAREARVCAPSSSSSTFGARVLRRSLGTVGGFTTPPRMFVTPAKVCDGFSVFASQNANQDIGDGEVDGDYNLLQSSCAQ